MFDKIIKNNLSEDLVEIIKKSILDTIGVCYGAKNYPCAKIISEFVQEIHPGSESFIWNNSEDVSILGACLANGITTDSLDMHDSSHNAKGHAGAALVPCAIAISGDLKNII